MSQPLYFDQINVGDRFESPRRTVTETDVVNFAGMTGDYDPLHVDHDFAANTPFKQPIAHGLLGLAFVAGLSIHNPWMKTAAFVSIRDWRFLKPIFFGDTVHVITEVTELAPRGRKRGQVIWKRQLINQHGDIVQEGYLETLVELSPQTRRNRTD